ncbi:hypothetical protein M3Y94_00975500 [Aphelenchoides besseyi]|nr:hypothetical protein M3Y94_00975500 [Aphelenchoides besseyi]
METASMASLQNDLYDFVCTFHRIKKITPKDAVSPGNAQSTNDEQLSNEQRGEQMNRLLYKILNEIEQRIILLPGSTEPAVSEYFDEWSFLTWSLLSIINRLLHELDETSGFLDYGGKHFQEKIHAALVDLVNKAQRLEPPLGVPNCDPTFERFYQVSFEAEESSLIVNLRPMLPHLLVYTICIKCLNPNGYLPEFEAQISLFKEQLSVCFQLQRDFCNSHRFYVWNLLRTSQIQKMTKFGFNNKGFLANAMSFYSHMLYNLGVLAARLQVTMIRNNKGFTKPDLINPLLQMVYSMVEMLLSDSIICTEPSQNPILVTNNLFPTKVVSLCRCTLFRRFQFQIISEEVAQQIQQEMRHKRMFDQPVPVRPTPSAALLAMKPSSGVKRNNATASAEGGNTAHKKSDVNSKEWISIPPTYDSSTHSFTGGFYNAHTLSMPFAIATRRNQDCQVQRMMSSYTATCFWLYGTAVLDDLLLQWYDNGIDWKHFKDLYAQYFSMNAEVSRTLTEEDFEVLENKMQCQDCEERILNTTPNQPSQQPLTTYQSQNGLAAITFKNVLCPHLHYRNGKTDVKFSVWRGMLELLHLFSDQRTEIKTLWESTLLQGFMEKSRVHALLADVESAMILHLSFIVGGCVLFVVKSGGQILNLEPLDLKRLQAKSLYEYLRDVLIAEKIEFVLNSNHEWIRADDAMKLCQKTSDAHLQTHPTEKEITSNVTHTDKIDVEETLRFTPMRVAVVTCKAQRSPDEISQEIPALPTFTNEEFEQQLEKLMYRYGKTRMEVINTLNRKAVTAAAAVASPVQPPISAVHLPASVASTSQMQPIYHPHTHHHSPSLPHSELQQLGVQQQNGFRNTGLMSTNTSQQPNVSTVQILNQTRRWDDIKTNGHLPLQQPTTLSFWPNVSAPLDFADADKLLNATSLDPTLRFPTS